MSDRERILQAVRAALATAAAAPGSTEDGGAAPSPRVAAEDCGALVARFCARVTAVGGRVADGRSVDVPTVVRDALHAAGARRVACGGGPAVAALVPGLGAAGFDCSATTGLDAMFAADAGITAAQWGVAETGSLALDHDVTTARLASLLPPLHIALLPRDRILADLDALLAALPRPVPHAVTLITGPSRTADIELQLVIGVHGPRDLLVVLV